MEACGLSVRASRWPHRVAGETERNARVVLSVCTVLAAGAEEVSFAQNVSVAPAIVLLRGLLCAAVFGVYVVSR